MFGSFVRHTAVAIILGFAVFITAVYCLSFPSEVPGAPSLWLASGLPLVALLRTSERRWPLLILTAIIGNALAPVYYQGAYFPMALAGSLIGCLQYYLSALVLRRRFGDYFDLTNIPQLSWLIGMGALTTAIKVLGIASLRAFATGGITLDLNLFALTSLNIFLGPLALALPILAITSRRDDLPIRFDGISVALLAGLIGALFMVFGPPSFPGIYIAMPFVMLLAVRHGLIGSGIGTLVVIILSVTLSQFSDGMLDKLSIAGFGPSERGTYLSLYYGVAVLMSLPIAVARARQRVMDSALASALAASERRAALLAESEAAARASEMVLQETENRWRAALEGSGLGVWDWDVRSDKVYFSGVWRSMFGYTDEQIATGLDAWAKRIHPEDRDEMMATVRNYMSGGSNIYESEHRALCKDGSYKWIHDRGMIFERAPDGSPIRMIGTHTDIDAAKQAALRNERHARLYVALAACNAAIARRASIADLAATICEILVTNGNMSLAWIGFVDRDSGLITPYRSYGSGISYLDGIEISVDPDDPRGRGPTGTAFREDRPVWINDFLTDPRTIPWQERSAPYGWHGSAALPLRRKDKPTAVLTMYTGEIGFFDEETCALLNDMASQFSLALDTVDAEDAARRFQESLARSEQLFRTMFESAPLGIALMDTRDSYFLSVNAMFETIVGWTNDELLSKTWQDITHPEDLEADWKLAAPFMAGRIPGYQIEKRYVRKDGKSAWVHMTIARFELPGAERPSHLCMIEDITEQKARAQQAHLTQRMEAIGQLTGGVAHDFNNLLTIVIGSSETLITELDQPSHRMLAELILQAAEQGGELTRQLLAFSRRQPLAPQAFDVTALLNRTTPLIQRTLGADLDFRVQKSVDLHRIFADPAQTESALLNLCLNARDAMPDGGILTIAVENIGLSEEEARVHPDAQPGDYVAIRVSDTGAGVPPDLIGRIFEPFFTTKETGKGTGLGLSMVYGFVKQSGGYIDLVSEAGKGTSFTLHLPAAPLAETVLPLRDAGPRAIEGGSENVLIVEDNDLVREHVKSQFESLGYQVLIASNGAEALALLEDNPEIDLLFTDIVMPGGMNGRELAERAVARRPSLRVLYTSGFSRDALTRDGQLLDNVTLLPKPYSKRELSEKVRTVLDEVP